MYLYNNIFKGISVFLLFIGFSNTALSLNIVKEKLDLNTYIRGTALIGKDGHKGVDPTEGADFGLTLFDQPYLETKFVFRPSKEAAFHLQIALNNETLHHLDTGTQAQWVVRDFYGEFFNVGTEGSSLWLGSRKFSLLAEHDFFGGGYDYRGLKDTKIGMSYGVKKDTKVWGYKIGNDPLDKVKDTVGDPYRHYAILDVERMIAANGNVKLLLETQYVGPRQLTAKHGDDSVEFELDAVKGNVFGAEINFWGDGWNDSTALSYSAGSVAGSGLSKLNTKTGAALTVTTKDNKEVKILENLKDSKRYTLTNSGSFLGNDGSVSWLLAYSKDILQGVDNKSMYLLQARPFYFINSKFHLGADLSRLKNLTGYDQPSAYVIAPTIRRSLNFDSMGKPLVQVFYAKAFFDESTTQYGRETKSSTTVGLQFEAWF